MFALINPQWGLKLKQGSEVIKLYSCSTQLSTKFIILINVKMPTIVGILTLISMLNATSECLRARKVGIFQQLEKALARLLGCVGLSESWLLDKALACWLNEY